MALTSGKKTVMGSARGLLNLGVIAAVSVIQGGFAMLQAGNVRPARTGQGGTDFLKMADAASARAAGVAQQSVVGGGADGAKTVDVQSGEDMKGAQRESDLVQLADVATVAEAQSFIEKKLVEAGTIIDSYVASKYGDRAGLPVPATLRQLAIDIAYYRMHRVEPPKKVEKEFDAAMKTLRDIADGRVKIDDGVETQPTRPGAILIEGQEKIFGRSNMVGF